MRVRAKIIIDIETGFEDENSTSETLLFCLSEDIQNNELYTLHDIQLANELELENECLNSKIKALESDLFHEKMNCEIMTKRAEALEAVEESRDRFVEQFNIHTHEVARLSKLVDNWKQRAEALERAIKSSEMSGECDCCIYEKVECDVEPCKSCDSEKANHWQFDEARFTEDVSHE